MPALQNVRLRNLFRKPLEEEDYGTISPLRDYLMDSGLSDEDPFVSPVEPSLDTPQLGRVATDITAKTGEPKRNWRQMMDELYTPETTSRDRFNRLLEEFPQREEPGFLRKLVASGASLGNVRRKIPGGLEAAENVMYAPYMRDVGEWKERAEPYSKAAQLENQANAVERQLAGNILSYETQAERNRIQEEKNEARRQVDLIRANAYAAKANGAEVKIVENQVIATYPDGRVEFLGAVPGTSTAAELANIRGKHQIEAAKVAGAGLYQGPGGITIINPRDPSTLPPGLQGPITEVGTPRAADTLNPGEVQKDLSNRLQRIYATDPTKRKFIEANDDGTYTLIEPPSAGVMPWSWSQADVDEYNKFAKEIYGLAPAAPAPAPTAPAPTGPRTAAPSPTAAPPGNVPPQTVTPQVPPQIPPPQTTAPAPVVPQRTLPSSSVYGPGAVIPDVRNVPFQGPRQPPGPIVNPPSSSVYGPGATPRPAPGAIAPSSVPPSTATLQQRPTAKPGYVIIMKGGQIVGQIPETERDQAIREGYAVVR